LAQPFPAAIITSSATTVKRAWSKDPALRSFFHRTGTFLSALLHAERCDEILALMAREPKTIWAYRQWGVRALEFMKRLAALMQRPRLHLIRFHGVLAPRAKLRAAIVPSPAQDASAHAADHAHHSARAHELGTLTQTGFRYRSRTLPKLWRALKNHCRHRSAGDR
jgi:hypothetical protein